MKKITFFLVTILTSPYLVAQGNTAEVCNAALAKDITTTFTTEQQDLDFLSIVDERTFNEAKQKGSFGVSVPLADDLLQLSAKWDNFQTNRSSYFKQVGYSSHTSASDLRHFEISSPVAYQAWTTCILAFSRQQTGLFAWKEKEDKDNVVVRVVYHSPGRRLPTPFKATIKRGNENETPLNTGYRTLSNEQVATIILPRSTRSGSNSAPAPTIYATFKADIFSDFIYSTWTPPPSPPTITTEVQHLQIQCAKSRGELTNEGVKNLVGFYCSAPGTITDVHYDKCLNTTSDDVCGHIWYTNHFGKVPPGNQIDAQFTTDTGNAAGILYITLFYDVTSTKCTGEGCAAFKPPSEVLK
jgi:hypothetical protein